MKKIIISFLGAAMLVCTAFAQAPTGDILVQNATVLTVTKGTLENTDVLIQDGFIKKIGKNLKAPNGVEVVDATGKFVMPGIIDAHSHIALDVVNDASKPVTADVYVGDAINPQDIAIYRAIAGGTTAAHAMHGSANPIGGECETIKLRYGHNNPDALRMEDAPRTIKFALGENPMRVHGEGRGIQPATRMGVEQVFRSAFEEALDYKRDWALYNGAKKEGKIMAPPMYSERLETLQAILDGEIIVHCHSYRADEIYMLLNVLKDYGVKKIVFQHVNEGFKVAPELAEYGAMASVFSDWWAYKFEVYYSTAYNAAILKENGVVTSINSDDAGLIRHLNHEAAKTQRYGGLSDDDALALVTINPAIQLGVEDRIGSIEEGKEGDLAIFDKHPLSVYAINQMTIIDGIKYFDINEDADDMRLMPDPEKAMPASFLQERHSHHGHSHDRCMQGVLFSFSGN